jgi:nucleoid-associated protein YgaU
MSQPTAQSGQFYGNVEHIVLTDGANTVEFDLNPESVEMSREARPHDAANVQAATAEAALQLSGNLILTLNKCQFIGPTVEARMNQLLDWAKGSETTAPTAGGTSAPVLSALPGVGGSAQVKAVLQTLTMTWGTTRRLVIVQGVTIRFDQFSTNGTPLGATATIKLVCQTPPLPGTNPTSGGLPGRSSHVLVSGENLVGLATSTYGAPRYWQRLAEINNIDDPLRVAPGREIYLPSPSEL